MVAIVGESGCGKSVTQTSLNPIFTVGRQMTDIIRTHQPVSKKETVKIAFAALEAVGIPEPQARMKNYPFELSGGMRQRVLIALSVACHAKLIIADEPATALDVTTQAQVMEVLLGIVKKYRSFVPALKDIGNGHYVACHEIRTLS